MDKEYLNRYAEELNQYMLVNFKLIEFESLNSYYGDTRLNPVRDEICKCIICNLPQATITLTNHLLELALKTCLIRKYLKNNQETLPEDIQEAFKEGLEEYDNEKLVNTINFAFDHNLLTEEQKTILHKYRNIFRNAWGHANANKIFNNDSILGKKISLSKEDNVEEFIKEAFDNENKEQYKVKSFLPIQGVMQVQLAYELCIPYFKDVDKIIRDMLQKI